MCACVYRVCVCVYACPFPGGESASRILARGFLPIRTWRREQMELSEVCSRFGVPLPPHPRPHPRTLNPSLPPSTSTASCAQPLQFHQSNLSFFHGKATAPDPLRSRLSGNAWPHVRGTQHTRIKSERIIWVMCDIGGGPAMLSRSLQLL